MFMLPISMDSLLTTVLCKSSVS